MDRLVDHLRADWGDSVSGVRQARLDAHFDSLLLVYYFGFMDGDGSGEALHRYYRGIAQEMMGWRAWRKNPRETERPRPRDDPGSWSEWGKEYFDKLIAGRSDEQLKAEIDEKFRAMGVRF